MKNKTWATWAVVIGILCVIGALIYWLVPAGSLPTFMPGYIAGATTVHFKHGLGLIIIALALFSFAWFKSAKQI